MITGNRTSTDPVACEPVQFPLEDRSNTELIIPAAEPTHDEIRTGIPGTRWIPTRFHPGFPVCGPQYGDPVPGTPGSGIREVYGPIKAYLPVLSGEPCQQPARLPGRHWPIVLPVRCREVDLPLSSQEQTGGDDTSPKKTTKGITKALPTSSSRCRVQVSDRDDLRCSA